MAQVESIDGEEIKATKIDDFIESEGKLRVVYFSRRAGHGVVHRRMGECTILIYTFSLCYITFHLYYTTVVLKKPHMKSKGTHPL